jgi:hypothetical protein
VTRGAARVPARARARQWLGRDSGPNTPPPAACCAGESLLRRRATAPAHVSLATAQAAVAAMQSTSSAACLFVSAMPPWV